MSSSTVQKATGTTTDGSPPSACERRGESENTANTPKRARAISQPMARAISLPSNQRAIALLTVIPAISQPQPNIMKPRAASLAEPGIAVHHDESHPSKAVPTNSGLMA